MTEVLWRSGCILGEAPVWHAIRRSCFWVDVEQKAIYEYHWDRQQVSTYQLACRVSLIVPYNEYLLLLALEGGIAKYDLRDASLTMFSTLDIDWNGLRCNDGGVDPKGRLWISTMSLKHEENAGKIYRLEQGGSVSELMSGISIPNGLSWSGDQAHMYFTDSIKAEIYDCSFDRGCLDISSKKTAFRLPAHLGLPDGMAVDAEGMLWIALWGGYGIGRFDPGTGEMLDFIEVPAPHVTCCCFAGDNFDQLVITTARAEMSDEALQQYPESGNVFIVQTNISGARTNQLKL